MTATDRSVDPPQRFTHDRQAARDAKDPMAAVCVLATVDQRGMPQARTLVLRDIPEGLAIYINASSPKWQQSQEHVAIQVCGHPFRFNIVCRRAARLCRLSTLLKAGSCGPMYRSRWTGSTSNGPKAARSMIGTNY